MGKLSKIPEKKWKFLKKCGNFGKNILDFWKYVEISGKIP